LPNFAKFWFNLDLVIRHYTYVEIEKKGLEIAKKSGPRGVGCKVRIR